MKKYKKINRILLKYIKRKDLLKIIAKDDFVNKMFYGIMEYHIENGSRKTFGKILSEHFCTDTVEGKENSSEKIVLNILYKSVEDFIKEDPNDTLIRLQKIHGI